MWMMNDIEQQLVDYLNNDPKIIKKALQASLLNYEYIKVLEVSIDDDMEGFEIVVEFYPGGRSHSWLKMPNDFLRKLKLENIDSK